LKKYRENTEYQILTNFFNYTHIRVLSFTLFLMKKYARQIIKHYLRVDLLSF